MLLQQVGGKYLTQSFIQLNCETCAFAALFAEAEDQMLAVFANFSRMKNHIFRRQLNQGLAVNMRRLGKVVDTHFQRNSKVQRALVDRLELLQTFTYCDCIATNMLFLVRRWMRINARFD